MTYVIIYLSDQAETVEEEIWFHEKAFFYLSFLSSHTSLTAGKEIFVCLRMREWL